MANSVNFPGRRPLTHQVSTPAGPVPVPSNILPQELSAGTRAELERNLAELPADLQVEVRPLLDSGRALSSSAPTKLVRFFLGKDLSQAAIDIANIAGLDSLWVRTSIASASLVSMHDNCRSLQTLNVYSAGPDQPNGVEEFLRAGYSFTSLNLFSDDAPFKDILKALGPNQGVKHLAITQCAGRGPWIDALSETLHANQAIESLSVEPWNGLSEVALERLSAAIAKSPTLGSMELTLSKEVEDIAVLVTALEGRSMKQLTLKAVSANLLHLVDAIWAGRFRVENLHVFHRFFGVPSKPSAFIVKLCDLIRSSSNVGALSVDSKELTLVANELCEAVARTRLYKLRLQTPMPKPSIDALIEALGRNPCLCEFGVNGATDAQKEKIRSFVEANGKVAVRLAMGHAFADQVALPRDAGAGVADHLTGTEAQRLVLLNRDMHQANMKGQLVGLVQQGDFQGITRLCERWASLDFTLRQSVLDELLDVARSQWRRQGNQLLQAEAARNVLQALVDVKRHGVPRYVPSKAELEDLQKLAGEAKDGKLGELVNKLLPYATA